jgi:hypothetical protein
MIMCRNLIFPDKPLSVKPEVIISQGNRVKECVTKP